MDGNSLFWVAAADQRQVCSKDMNYRGSPTSTVSTSTISTSTIFIAIGIKSVLVEFSRIGYVVKFVLCSGS